ncbi:Uncharacterised protein [Chlamydia trachomatis]|nr:Uncharacterised protein [Chlamydia trachomatis]
MGFVVKMKHLTILRKKLGDLRASKWAGLEETRVFIGLML